MTFLGETAPFRSPEWAQAEGRDGVRAAVKVEVRVTEKARRRKVTK
jgi:hypothetical protein